ncbi:MULTISPECIES: N-6 DNA methylase [Halorussus]|uniref:Eco57I restriction-modification methylase domain-containing protein n=1 Tax=Halorussus TaxID=1070314 RepID=UPI000E210897|nr:MULTISPECIES: N-6 DNA methylase [Halorussus]NHN58504.1 N-6 DNA methylase [Halorussus sp. JP-T4]
MADISPITPAAPDHQWVDKDHGIPEFSRSVDTDRLAEIITTVADRLAPAFAEIPDSLHGRVDTWCLSHGLNDATTSARRRLVARQAVLTRLLKATVYEWHHRRGELPEFPADTWEIIQSVAEVGANPGFGECVLDYFLLHVDESEMEVIDENRDRLLASTQPAEDIGRLYEAVTPKECRQVLSQFRTPPDIGQLMQSWAGESDDTVMDPGMGAGVLSSPFHPDWRLSTDPARINGIDRSQLALLMGSTALTLSGQPHELNETDFLNLRPADLQQDVDAIVCNPPYTKGDALQDWYKERTNTQLEEATGIEISARSPLHAYFIYHSRAFLSPGDRAAFITPQSFLSNRYGESLKQFLLDNYTIKAFVQFNPESYCVFDNADTTALLTFLEAKPEGETAGETHFIRVDEKVESKMIREAVENGEPGSTDWGFINRVPQTDLRPKKNWQVLFDPVEIDTSHLPQLGKFLTIHRGPTTGEVNLFCLSKQEVEENDLDERHLSRIVRKPSQIDGYDYQEFNWQEARANGKDVWLLDPDQIPRVPNTIADFKHQFSKGANREAPERSDIENGYSAVREYLRDGVIEYGLNDTSTFSNRPYWYRPRRKDPTRVLVQNASRDQFRFILNETDVRNTNACYGFYDITLSETELKALLAYLNSDIFDEVVRKYKQTRDGGLDKIEPNQLEQVPVINPPEMRDETVNTLAELFDELRQTARNNSNCNPVLDRIHVILQQEL